MFPYENKNVSRDIVLWAGSIHSAAVREI